MTLPKMVAASGGWPLDCVPVHHWTQAELEVLLHVANKDDLLAADAAACGTFIAPSTGHGREVFAARPLLEGERILPSFVQLMYKDLDAAASSPSADSVIYGPSSLPRALRCTATVWQKTSLELRMDRCFWSQRRARFDHYFVATELATKTSFATRSPSSRSCWVVPASFCAAGFVNDHRPHYLSNARFYQTHDPVSASSQLVVPGLSYVYVTQTIAAGEEILVNYGDAYKHPAL